jgi:hypothetical protein
MKTLLKISVVVIIAAVCMAPTTLMQAVTPTGQYVKDDGTTGPGGTGSYIPPTGTGWAHFTNGVQDAACTDIQAWAKATTKPTYTAAEVGADASGLAVSCTTGIGTKLVNDTATLGTRLKNDTSGLGTSLAGKLGTSAAAADVTVTGTAIAAALKGDTTGLGTALAGKAATSHTHTAIDTCNIRASKVMKLDSLKIVTGLRVTNTEQCGKLIVGTGTLALDSIEIKDGTTDTLIIGAFGKKWKFLPIANQ